MFRGEWGGLDHGTVEAMGGDFGKPEGKPSRPVPRQLKKNHNKFSELLIPREKPKARSILVER